MARPQLRSKLGADVFAAADVLRGLTSGLEPKDVPLSWAPEVLLAFCEAERFAQAGRLMMMSRAADAGRWREAGFATPEEWMASLLGTSTGKALADLDTSGKLDDLDDTKDAVKAGELSPEKAGAVTDAASVNPDAEKDLIEKAKKESLARTRREAERRKAEKQSEQSKAERDKQVREHRRARFWFGNGEGHAELHGPVAEMKKLEALIQREVDQMFRANRAEAKRGSRANYAFDAFVGLANTKAATGSTGDSGGAGRGPVTRMTMIRVDLAALKRGFVTTGELCEIGGVSVSMAELRAVLGDSVLQLVLTNGEAVVDIVNLNRKPTVAQKLAKLFTDATCCVQGCDRAAVVEFDHRVDWARNRVTELSNIDLFCDHHHDQKTYENWQLVAGTGRRPMVPPTDPRHPDYRAETSVETQPDARPDLRVVPDDPVPESPVEDSARDSRDGPGVADLSARLARIHRKATERDARAAGQDPLFDAEIDDGFDEADSA